MVFVSEFFIFKNNLSAKVLFILALSQTIYVIFYKFELFSEIPKVFINYQSPIQKQVTYFATAFLRHL